MSSVKIIRREHKQLLIGANDTDMHKNHFKTTTLIGHQKKMSKHLHVILTLGTCILNIFLI